MNIELIHSYTRAQAIDDGELVDVATLARQAGIRFPVAITRTAWDRYIDRTEEAGQSVDGRLWDTLTMLRHAARRAEGSQIVFRVCFAMPEAGDWRPNEAPPEPGSGLRRAHHRLVILHAVCGPGDTAEPVITIMLPGED